MVRAASIAVAVALAVSGCGGGSGAPDGHLTLVSLNILHGLVCPPETDGCRLPDRVALTMRLVEERGCPDVVALQEVSPRIRALLKGEARRRCDGRYREVWIADGSADRELVLTTLTSSATERWTLAGGMRTALWTRLDTGVGDVDLVVTHLGAGGNSDGTGGGVCLRRTCPPPCRTTMTLHQCQLVQLGSRLRHARGDGQRRVAVVVGDFNLAPDARPLVSFVRDNGLVDAYLAGGNRECDPSTAQGCTAGRGDSSVAALSDPTSNEHERIDYAFVTRSHDCIPVFRSGLFADHATPDGPGGLAWPSDHVGVALDLSCRRG